MSKIRKLLAINFIQGDTKMIKILTGMENSAKIARLLETNIYPIEDDEIGIIAETVHRKKELENYFETIYNYDGDIVPKKELERYQ